MKCAVMFFLLLVQGWLSVFGQSTLGYPQIINYNKNEYHGGTQTWDIAQDKRGVMYFANNEGLLTFDGTNWNIYPLGHKTIMRSLAIGEDNKIYVGGQGEIGYFSPDARGKLRFISLERLIPETDRLFADVWNTVIYHGTVFFQTSNHIFEYRDNSIKVYQAKSNWQYITVTNERLFANDRVAGLFEYKMNGWYPPRDIQSKNPEVSGLIHTGNNRLLLSTKKDGVFIFRNGAANPITNLNRHPDFHHISSTARISYSEYAAGTTAGGCIIFDTTGNIIQKITSAEGLQNNSVLCVFVDKDQNIWAGLNNGISLISYGSAIKFIKPNIENELPGYSTVIYDNHLYIATSDGVYTAPINNISRDISFSKGSFKPVANTRGEGWRLKIVNGKLLVAHNDGVLIIEGDQATPVMQGAGCWFFVPTTAVFPSPDILVGTYTGLLRLTYSEKTGFASRGRLSGLSESYRFIAIDNRGRIWASHPYRGIYQIKLNADSSKYAARLFTDKDGLPSSLENYVFKIGNRVVFGTSKGIYEFDDKTGKFMPSPLLNGTFRNTEIRYLREDDDGDIWFCSGKNIGIATKNHLPGNSSYSITYFPELSGQILSGFENIFPYNKENIFISSERGIIHLNYKKYIAERSRLKLSLNKIMALGKSDSLIFGGYFSNHNGQEYQQSRDEIVHLPKSYNSFHFEYSSPAYGFQNKIEYSYQLHGYDKTWSEWSSRPEKDYTNLSYGDYVFKIKSRDNMGKESRVVSYAFEVKPAWYQTGYAKVLYVIALLLAVYAVHKWQKRKFELQQIRFDDEKKRQQELHNLKLEKKEKEIIKLQNEKLAGEIKFKSRELADANMHLEERNSALVRVKGELEKLYKRSDDQDIRKALLLLKSVERSDSEWDQFARHFDEVNDDFLKKLRNKYPKLSGTDLKVCTYLKLNLSSKEIAQFMNISVRGVEISRYRLRKKLEIPAGENMNDFLNRIV